MVPSLEVRWFLPGPVPPAARAWFEGLGDHVEPESRTDRYLVPTESEDLGLKVREGRVEAKQRTGRLEASTWGRATARPEAWRKWTLGLATEEWLAEGWCDVAKTRVQRWVRDGEAACALELADVEVGGEAWWSVCLEASGGDATSHARVLDAAARRWLGRPDAPALGADAALGYPAWLRRGAG